MFESLIFDLDGTLLNSRKEILDSSLYAINRLRTEFKEMRIVICSGRHLGEILPYSHILSLKEEDSIISSDGLYINYAIGGEPIWHGKYLTRVDLLDICRTIGTNAALVFDDKHNYIFTSRRMIYIKYAVLLSIGKTKTIPLMNINLLTDNIEKVVVNDTKIEGLNYSIHEINQRTEILASGINKYNALIQLERFKRINLSQSIYFGDDMNDMECFKNLKNTVAMENADNEIKKRASYVTKTNNSDGIFRALMHYFPEILGHS